MSELGRSFTRSTLEQQIRVADPLASEPVACPLDKCGRALWLTRGDAVTPATNLEPDLLGRFGRDGSRLLDGGETLLVGPPEALDKIAEALEANHPTTDLELVDRVRELVQEFGRTGVFEPGRALVAAGHRARGI